MAALIRETFPVGPLQCNCTVLGDAATREGMVVDPGGNLSDILATIANHSLQLRSIVVTHAHLDHIASAAALHDLTGAPVLYHQADLALVAVMDQQAAWMGVPTPEVRSPDESAEAGKVLRLGEHSMHVLHTPGHTPGSICLHAPAAQLLLAGDTLFRGGIGRTDLWGGNASQILRSIQGQLLHLPQGTQVVPGHGSPTTIARELEHNSFLQSL